MTMHESCSDGDLEKRIDGDLWSKHAPANRYKKAARKTSRIAHGYLKIGVMDALRDVSGVNGRHIALLRPQDAIIFRVPTLTGLK